MTSSRSHHRTPRSSSGLRTSNLIAVAAGGLVGSAARAAIGLWLPVAETGFPTATLIVNLTGSFLLAIYLVRREQATVGGWSFRFWALGLFGSFTTFSAFSLEVTQLIGSGDGASAVIYVVVSVVGGLFAALLAQRLTTVMS